MKRLDLELDLSELRLMWQRRREAARSIRNRIDPRGMTRPARSAEERAWLEERGETSPFTEVGSGEGTRNERAVRDVIPDVDE